MTWFDLLKTKFFFCWIGWLLVINPITVQGQVNAPSAPIELKEVLSTLTSNDVIRHRIVDGVYRIDIEYQRSLLGIQSIQLECQADQNGTWTAGKVEAGPNLQVKTEGREEPKKYLVEAAVMAVPDPARKFENQVISRVSDEDGKVNTTRAKSETQRLINQYANQDHVLKLPRSASSRLDPEDTLRRLARWVAYDKLFFSLGMERRPAATESEAKETYQQVIDYLRGMPLPKSAEDRLIGAEELERIGEKLGFRYSISFFPTLVEDQPDENWSVASRIHFRQQHVGNLNWQGDLKSANQSSAWLAVKSEAGVEQLKVVAADDSDDTAVMWVSGPDDWRYLRLLKVTKSPQTKFQLRVTSGIDAGEVHWNHSAGGKIQFPF